MTPSAPASALTSDQSAKLEARGCLLLEDAVDAAALDALRAQLRRLPSWESGADGSVSDELQREGAFERAGVSYSGSALSRRAWMMKFGPLRADDPGNWLAGRKAALALPGPAPRALEELARAALGAEARLAAAVVERAFPGFPGDNADRVCAGPGAGALELVVPLEGSWTLLAHPGSHRESARARALAERGDLYVELLDGLGLEPQAPLSPAPRGAALLDGALLRREPGAVETWAVARFVFRDSRAAAPAPRARAAAARPTLTRRAIQLVKLKAWFPLSRWLHSPLKVVNVGAGHQWQHPTVLALDVDPETNVNLDVTEAGLPFAAGALEAVYSSHCIEHLTPPDAEAFLKEARRCLQPGGLLRLVCPDVDKLFDAYDRRDAEFFDWRHAGYYEWDGLLRTAARVGISTTVDRFDDEQLRALYAKLGRYGLMERLLEEQRSLAAEDLSAWPDGHKSWWTVPKLMEELKRAGFSEVFESKRDGSRLAVFRDPRYFDYSSPGMSLYVEAVR